MPEMRENECDWRKIGMTFKEFVEWCNDRAGDGCWGMIEAMTCIDIISNIRKLPFWKRKKEWMEKEQQILDEIVNPINRKIQEMNVIGVENHADSSSTR